MVELKSSSWQDRSNEKMGKDDGFPAITKARPKTLGCSRNRKILVDKSPEEHMKKKHDYDIKEEIDDLG